MSEKTLSICICVFNKVNFTKACLNDLIKLPLDHEIIVIDNASSDETKEEISKFKNIIYVKNEKNLFHSKACNQAFAISTGKNVLFLNNDIRVKSNHETWTQTIINVCEKSNGLVGPTMGQLDSNFNFVREANQQLNGNSYISGWCVAANKNIWNQLDINKSGQIWNEQFPMYFNDGDLSFRAKQKKIQLEIIPLPDVVHFGKISAAQINIQKLYTDGKTTFLKKWKNKRH